MTKVISWFVAIGALLVLAVAMLAWGLAPASECSTPHQIHWWGGLPAFAIFMLLGGYIAARGSLAQRLLLFLASGAVIAAYVGVLSLSLPMVIQTETGCAAVGRQ